MLNWVSNVSLPNIGCIIGFVGISMGILGNAIPTYCQDHSGRKDRFVFLHFKDSCMNTFFEQTVCYNLMGYYFFHYFEFYNLNITLSTYIIKEDMLEGRNLKIESNE
ncbi:hypothetical protein T4A_13395 [Trichinella pseudospiralis]|nr:hypothetical protein T4A_13395 [Trichinella pseudospiralis]